MKIVTLINTMVMILMMRVHEVGKCDDKMRWGKYKCMNFKSELFGIV